MDIYTSLGTVTYAPTAAPSAPSSEKRAYNLTIGCQVSPATTQEFIYATDDLDAFNKAQETIERSTYLSRNGCSIISILPVR
jgi:hypothetical protein